MILRPRSITRSPLVRSCLVAALILSFAPAQARAGASAPIDQCVASKLDAAGDLCRGALIAWAKWTRKNNRNPELRRTRLDDAATALSTAWAQAETDAGVNGALCATATGESEGTASDGASGAKQIAKSVVKAIDSGDRSERQCGARVLRAAANLCGDLLDAEAAHLAGRFGDRLREDLEEAREAADDAFTQDWLDLKDECKPPLSRGQVAGFVEDLVQEVVTVGTISSDFADGWETITPPASVDYEGQTLDPQCWDGAEYSFFVRRGSVNKLVMYYQGGGACWSAATCGGLPSIGISPTFKRSLGDSPEGISTGFADFENPKNPFKDWNVVVVPYCTGDIHWGDAEVDYVLDTGEGEPRVTSVAHKGFVNAQVAEKWAREHIVHPEQVFVTGSSAGAYGAIVNSLYLQERAYPSADFSVLGDAGNGVITQDFLENELSNWGIEENLPAWIPGLNVPLAELNAADLYIESAKTYPQNRFGTYTAAYDGGNGGQTGFFQIMRNVDNALNWVRWWDSSCRWNERMTALNAQAQAEAPNFRSYVGSGSAHTMWGRDKVYTDRTGNVPTVRSWVKAMVEDSDKWVNVECEDCGILLEGDPVPFLDPPGPFDVEAGRIDCDK